MSVYMELNIQMSSAKKLLISNIQTQCVRHASPHYQKIVFFNTHPGQKMFFWRWEELEFRIYHGTLYISFRAGKNYELVLTEDRYFSEDCINCPWKCLFLATD